MQLCLVFLKENHPEYRNITIDYDRFNVMPNMADVFVNVNISSNLTQVFKEEINNNYIDSVLIDIEPNGLVESELDNYIVLRILKNVIHLILSIKYF